MRIGDRLMMSSNLSVEIDGLGMIKEKRQILPVVSLVRSRINEH